MKGTLDYVEKAAAHLCIHINDINLICQMFVESCSLFKPMNLSCLKLYLIELGFYISCTAAAMFFISFLPV